MCHLSKWIIVRTCACVCVYEREREYVYQQNYCFIFELFNVGFSVFFRCINPQEINLLLLSIDLVKAINSAIDFNIIRPTRRTENVPRCRKEF